jgi:hypothetical protein
MLLEAPESEADLWLEPERRLAAAGEGVLELVVELSWQGRSQWNRNRDGQDLHRCAALVPGLSHSPDAQLDCLLFGERAALLYAS